MKMYRESTVLKVRGIFLGAVTQILETFPTWFDDMDIVKANYLALQERVLRMPLLGSVLSSDDNKYILWRAFPRTDMPDSVIESDMEYALHPPSTGRTREGFQPTRTEMNLVHSIQSNSYKQAFVRTKEDFVGLVPIEMKPSDRMCHLGLSSTI
jgi:hypothetical protein